MFREAITLVCICCCAGNALAGTPAPRGDTAGPQAYACDAGTAFTIGCAKLEAGDYEAAVRDLRIALAKRPDDPEFILRLAEGCLRTRRFAEAATLLERTFGESFGLRVAILRAEVERGRGDWVAAAEALAGFEDKLPAHERVALATALARSERFTDCSQVISRAVKKFARDVEVLKAWVEDAIAREQFATALERCETAERNGLPQGEILALRAAAQFGMGDVLGKIETRQLSEGTIGQLLVDGVVFARNRDGKSVRVATGECAIASARRALEMGFDMPALWLVYARCLLVGRQDHAAWAIVERQRPSILEQGDPRCLLGAAEVAVAAGQLEAFIHFTEAASKVLPSQANALRFAAYSRLAEEYNLRGQDAESLGFLTRAAEIKPDDMDVRLRLADAFWAVGERVLAAESYRQVLGAVPGHSERRRMMKRLAEFAQSERPAVAGASR